MIENISGIIFLDGHLLRRVVSILVVSGAKPWWVMVPGVSRGS